MLIYVAIQLTIDQRPKTTRLNLPELFFAHSFCDMYTYTLAMLEKKSSTSLVWCMKKKEYSCLLFVWGAPLTTQVLAAMDAWTGKNTIDFEIQ